MKFLDWFRSESKHFRATHLPLPSGPKTAVADVHYVRLWLVQMMLKDGRTLFDEFKAYHIMEEEEAWNRLQVNFLSAHRFHTRTNKLIRDPIKQRHLEDLKALVATY